MTTEYFSLRNGCPAMNYQDILILSDEDNVAVARNAIKAGTLFANGMTALEDIGVGHKLAIRAISSGAAVLKYGQLIGKATQDIAVGEHVHSHNLTFQADAVMPFVADTEVVRRSFNGPQTFDGFRRSDGRVGTRNFIGIIASVNCSSTVCRSIAEQANRRLLARFPNIDGFVPIVHGQGCGLSSSGEGMRILHRTLAGYARHPNFGGVLMIGLGCEVNQLSLYGQGGSTEQKRHFNIQDSGGSRKSVEHALVILEEIAAEVSREQRQPIPISELVVGLQCGGSDGMSGITANPALGVAMDMLVAAGGTAILSETPEIYGAEHLLRARAVSLEVAAKLDERLLWWDAYAQKNDVSLDNNPSPGNKRGGLTTILEKSLGAVAKGGRSPLRDVYQYAEQVKQRGLVFMDTPGYDPVSATGQVAGGANIITFTTGRGSCFGCHPTPSLKLASNTALYQAMTEDMDINCGEIASGEKTVSEMGHEILRLIIETASGRRSRSEEFGYGDNEFVPWQLGATL